MALINSLPTECGETLDRLLRERPITDLNDNWILRMDKLRGLDRLAAIELIDAWKLELDRRSVQ
ncbi:hypothetical protein HNQ60_000703 [Povalibacter uvarum]|uniref:Uncharacterized protein n=1 Tax=Povalibacter uvarum TaxID=732238 RepID=A0A841HG40_9GAMM|nr:hypothetical protein [Povalibacter uvarum]